MARLSTPPCRRVDGTLLPFPYYNITTAANARQTASGVTSIVVEPKLKVGYNGYQVDFRARPWGRAQIMGGIAVERVLTRDCETSQAGLFVDPNSLRYCDTGDMRATPDGPSLGAIPWAKSFKIAASFPLALGLTLSGTYQNLDLPIGQAGGGTARLPFDRTFTYGRTSDRYPDGSANFVAAGGTAVPATPCPSGQAACAVPGSLSAPATLTSTSVSLPIEPPGFSRDERLGQLDVKISKLFKFGRVTFSPTFEAFNLLNADTITGRTSLAYPSSNTGTSSYLGPSSVLKPRLLGIGALVKW